MEVSNADRVVFPDDGITKGEVVTYYLDTAEHMLPYIEGRAVSVERFPRGIGGQGFMQKNVPDHAAPELIGRYEVPKEEGGTTVYPVIDSAEGIGFFANLGVITFHVPSTRIDSPDRPDWAIWDLDPPPGEVGLVREAAAALREVLEEHGITTWLMTSGSKGYHLRANLRPGLDLDEVAVVARGTASLAAWANDDLMTVAFRKADRGNRVFVDWLRNRHLSTSVAPWSIRPRSGAPVASPLAWDELGSVEPDGVRMGDVEGRLRRDPWAGVEPIDITPALGSVGAALDEAGIDLQPFDRFRS